MSGVFATDMKKSRQTSKVFFRLRDFMPGFLPSAQATQERPEIPEMDCCMLLKYKFILN